MNTLKIAVCYHRDCKMLEQYANNKATYELFLGGSEIYKGDSKFLLSLRKDNIGENLSSKNKEINELSIVYWIWKNYEQFGNPDYVGLNHYRRCFTAEDIVDYDKYDMCIYENIICEKKLSQYKSMLQQYERWHGKYKIEKFFQYLTSTQDKDAQYIIESFNKPIFYPKNMFIMKKDLFFEYCQWLFRHVMILLDLLKVTNDVRAVSYISERLSSIFYLKAIEQHSHKFIPIPDKYI